MKICNYFVCRYTQHNLGLILATQISGLLFLFCTSHNPARTSSITIYGPQRKYFVVVRSLTPPLMNWEDVFLRPDDDIHFLQVIGTSCFFYYIHTYTYTHTHPITIDRHARFTTSSAHPSNCTIATHPTYSSYYHHV